MRSYGLLHPEMLTLIARVGHGDTIVIADAGLPIPSEILRIDLAVVPGLPDLLSVLEAVQKELVIESLTLAQEIHSSSPEFYKRLSILLTQPVTEVNHEILKSMLPYATAVIRTGEITPFSNIVLHCGVNF